MWGSYLETRITYTRSWSQTICYKLYVILGKQTMEFFFLGHSNLYRLTSCDIPSSNLVIYDKCWRAKCLQWQWMAYKMCINSMACPQPMKLVWTTPILLLFSIYNIYFSNIIMILLNSLYDILAIVIIFAISLIWVTILHHFARSPWWYTWQVLSYN
jgi:hypothetical protein